MQKKTLIAKLPMDVSLLSTAQIEACKAYMTQAFAGGGLHAKFEVITEDVEDASFLASLMEQVGSMSVGELASPVPQPPMDVMELDEGQSNVLRGFFGTSHNGYSEE